MLTPSEIHRALDRVQHALCDLPPDVREVLDDFALRVAGSCLEAHAAIERLRGVDAPERAALFGRCYQRSES